MTDVATAMPVLSPKTDRETGIVSSMSLCEPVNLELILSSRETRFNAKELLARLRERARNLSSVEQDWLAKLARKTTNRGRLEVLTSGDSRGLAGYLRHADIPEFPKTLWDFAKLTNKSINSILKSF